MPKKVNLSFLISTIVFLSILIFTAFIIYFWTVDYNYFIDRQALNQMSIMSDNINHRFVSFLDMPKESHQIFTNMIIRDAIHNEESLIDISVKINEYLHISRDKHQQISGVSYTDDKSGYVSISFNDDNNKYYLTIQSQDTVMKYNIYQGTNMDSPTWSSQPKKDVNFSPLYLPFLIGDQLIWSDLYISEENGIKKASISALQPLYLDEELKGVSALDIKLGGLTEFLRSQAVEYNSVIMLISGKNELIAHTLSDESNIISDEIYPDGRLRKFTEYNSELLKKIGEFIVSEDITVLTDTKIAIGNKNYLIKIHQLESTVGLEWYSIILKDEALVIRELQKRWRRNLLIISVISVLILLSSSIIVRQISKYLRELREFAQKLHHRKYREVKPVGDIYIRELSDFNIAFNILLSDIHGQFDEIEESRKKYKQVFETSYEGIWHYNLLSDTISLGDIWFKSLGYDKALIESGKAFLERIIHKDDINHLIFWNTNWINQEKDTINEEFRLTNNEGQEFWILSKGTITKRDDIGNAIEVVGGFIEISNRKQMEYQLSETLEFIEKLYSLSTELRSALKFDDLVKKIFNQLKTVVDYQIAVLESYEDDVFKVITDSEGLTAGMNLQYNKSDYDCYNFYELNNLIQMNDIEDLPYYRKLGLGDRNYSYIRLPLVRSKDYFGFITLIRQNKDTLTNQHMKTLNLFLDQVTVAFYNVKLFQEINQAKDIADKASRAKSEFLANMSHELRTPMNAVIGYSELLNRTVLTDNQKELLVNLRYASTNLLDILNDILDLSRIEEGKLLIESTPFNIKELVRKVSVIMGFKKANKLIDFNTQMTGQVTHYCIGDPLKIQQILMNLVGNALKFTSEGQVSLELDAKEYDDTIKCTLQVRDTGIGIEADVIESLFEKFTQGDSSTTRKYGGSGLGLSIVKSLVDLMGGTISVESHIGQGSNFKVDLTFEKGEEITETSSYININKDKKRNYFKKKVLIVEDNKFNMDIINRLLVDMAIETDQAFNGREAVDLCKENYYHLIFMDFQMPVMDGIEATKILREIYSKDELPIIALTAHSLIYDKEQSLLLGFNDYLSKPIDTAELYMVLEKYIGQLSLQDTSSNQIKLPIKDLLGDQYNAVKERFLGDWLNYRKTLEDFIQRFVSADEHISQLIEIKDLKQVQSYAHTYAGVSGNLGFIDLQTQLKKIENTDDLQTLEIEFSKIHISQTLEKLKTWLDENPVLEEVTSTKSKALSKEELNNFINLLSMKDFESLDCYEHVKEGLKSQLDESSIKALESAMNMLDFAKAEQIISEITSDGEVSNE